MSRSGAVADRRPWLILSRSEATVLHDTIVYECANLPMATFSPLLKRALRQVELQLEWIHDGGDAGEEPSIRAALEREGFDGWASRK